jgi:hypothetical protein
MTFRFHLWAVYSGIGDPQNSFIRSTLYQVGQVVHSTALTEDSSKRTSSESWKPAILRTCSISGKQFDCMTARPSPQETRHLEELFNFGKPALRTVDWLQKSRRILKKVRVVECKDGESYSTLGGWMHDWRRLFLIPRGI